MKFLKYNIDSQSNKNLDILNTSYRSFYNVPKDFVFFIICYKVIDVYLGKVHFHNTDTLIARNIDTLSII